MLHNGKKHHRIFHIKQLQEGQQRSRLKSEPQQTVRNSLAFKDNLFTNL